jgi:hypothetical protein
MLLFGLYKKYLVRDTREQRVLDITGAKMARLFPLVYIADVEAEAEDGSCVKNTEDLLAFLDTIYVRYIPTSTSSIQVDDLYGFLAQEWKGKGFPTRIVVQFDRDLADLTGDRLLINSEEIELSVEFPSCEIVVP